MEKIRIMHFINQYFAGIGGEDKADALVDYRRGPVGPSKRLQDLCGDSVEIAVTAYCGDNYFTEQPKKALERILQIAREQDVKFLVAGPAFASGRYGFACVEVCQSVSTTLGLDCVTGMHVENPGVATYRQYKNRRVWLFPTSEAVTGMENALSKLGQCVRKLAAGVGMGSAAEEKYITRGIRQDEFVEKRGVERAVNMLLNKVAGRPFVTEIPVESLEAIPVAPRVASLKDTHLALVSTSGVVPEGNPDGFRGYQNTQWKKYSIGKLDSMTDSKWDVIHRGYNTDLMKENPNYGVPLDVCREMEREGVFAGLYPYFYVAPGARGLISAMEAIGREIVRDMKAESVDAVILVST